MTTNMVTMNISGNHPLTTSTTVPGHGLPPPPPPFPSAFSSFALPYQQPPLPLTPPPPPPRPAQPPSIVDLAKQALSQLRQHTATSTTATTTTTTTTTTAVAETTTTAASVAHAEGKLSDGTSTPRVTLSILDKKNEPVRAKVWQM